MKRKKIIKISIIAVIITAVRLLRQALSRYTRISIRMFMYPTTAKFLHATIRLRKILI